MIQVLIFFFFYFLQFIQDITDFCINEKAHTLTYLHTSTKQRMNFFLNFVCITYEEFIIIIFCIVWPFYTDLFIQHCYNLTFLNKVNVLF